MGYNINNNEENDFGLSKEIEYTVELGELGIAIMARITNMGDLPLLNVTFMMLALDSKNGKSLPLTAGSCKVHAQVFHDLFVSE